MSTVAPVTEAAKSIAPPFYWAVIGKNSFTGLVMSSVDPTVSPFPHEFADYLIGPCATYLEAAEYLRDKLEQRAKAAEAAFDQWDFWLDQYQEAGGK